MTNTERHTTECMRHLFSYMHLKKWLSYTAWKTCSIRNREFAKNIKARQDQHHPDGDVQELVLRSLGGTLPLQAAVPGARTRGLPRVSRQPGHEWPCLSLLRKSLLPSRLLHGWTSDWQSAMAGSQPSFAYTWNTGTMLDQLGNLEPSSLIHEHWKRRHVHV